MAWRKANTVAGLKLKIHGTSIELGNFTGFPLAFSDELLQVASDPWGKSFSYGGLNHNTNYDIIAGAGAGSLDLRPYFYSLNTNESMYIYSDTFGDGVNIEFVRTGSMSGNTFVNYYGQRSGGISMKISVQTPEAGYISWMSFALFVNDDTGEGTLVTCGNATYYMSGLGERADRAEQAGFGSNASPLTHVVYMLVAGHEIDPPGPGEGPYGDDDYDEPIGGDGDHDETSDTIDTSPIPIAAATRCGMVTAFVPTWGEVQTVADALLDPNIFQILSSTVVRASDVIIGLSTFPCTVPATNTAAVTANFLGINIGTGVVAHVADDQYLEVDCGDLTINEYWGNCLDYNPYTSVSIFLPFCGMYELDVDEVMGKTLNVTYRVDIFSGACLATIKIDGSVFYQYTGQCSSQIPLNSVSFDNFLSSMLEIGIATATGVAAVKGAAGAVAESEKAFSDASSSNAMSALEDIFSAKEKYTKVKENSGANMLNAAVSSVIGGKGQYSHAGAMGGSPGFLAVKTPFVIIKRPEQVIPSMYGKFHGYPANTTANLGDLNGYTVVSDIRLNIPEATVDEIIECEQLLKGGVVL